MSEPSDLEDFGAACSLSNSNSEVFIEEPERYNEKCGVFGCFNVQKAAHTCYYGMVGLQHRGQEGGGMVSYLDFIDCRVVRRVVLRTMIRVSWVWMSLRTCSETVNGFHCKPRAFQKVQFWCLSVAHCLC
jgi:hypothetical protein